MSAQFPRMRFGMFSLAEFASIADMPVENIRVWRSRGHIGGGGGRGAKYPASEVAEAMFRYDLSRYGIPPSESVDIGYDCAGRILRYIMFNHADCCEVRGPADAVEHLREVHQNSDALTRLYYGAGTGDELLVRLNGGELEFMPSEGEDLHLRAYRSALVFNLQGYAAQLAKSSDKPIMTFQFECREGEPEVRASLADK